MSSLSAAEWIKQEEARRRGKIVPSQSSRQIAQPMQTRPVVNLMDQPIPSAPLMEPMRPMQTRPVVNLMDQPITSAQSRRPSSQPMAPSEEQIAWPGLEQRIARGIEENIRVQEEGRLKNAFKPPLYEKPIRLSAMPQPDYTRPSIEEQAAEWRAKEARREHERKLAAQRGVRF